MVPFELLCLLIYIYLHSKCQAFTKSIPKLQPLLTKTAKLLCRIIPKRNHDATKLAYTQGEVERWKTFLGSSLTDNAIDIQVMCLLQLDLELSV